MDYQKNITATPVSLSRSKKYDGYVRSGTQHAHRIARESLPAAALFGRLRQSPSGASSPMAHRSVERVLPSNQVISSSAPIAQKSTSNSYKPMSIAYQAALFSVRQSTATRQDLLAEQFSGTFDDEDLRRRKLTRAQKLFYAAGSLVFFFALVVSMQSILTNRQAKEQLGVLGAQTQLPDEYGVPEGTGNEPAEAEVPKAAMSAYKVSPELPRYIRIPELSVVARVKHSGVTKEGAIDAPANINDVSWYNQSAKPGSEIGASLLLGHVSGWTSPGVFKKINQLKSGMRFEIEMGSGEKITYEVTHGQSIPLSMLNMGEILTPEVAGEHDLKLMTCSGRFNREADQYEERYVVYAKIVR